MVTRARLAMGAAAGLLASASSIVSGCFVISDFDGIAGGVMADGASPADAADVTDSGVEASAADGGFSCAGSLFCDDFDTGTLVPPWTRVYTAPGTSVRIVPDGAARSAPNLLAVEHPSVTGDRYAYVARDVDVTGAPVTGARFTFAFSATRYDASARACIGGFYFIGDGDADRGVRLLAGKSTATLEEKTGSGSVLHPLSKPIPAGGWHEITLELTVGGRMSVAVDGDERVDLAPDPSWAAATRNVRVFVGVNFVLGELTDGFSLRFDDVRLVRIAP